MGKQTYIIAVNVDFLDEKNFADTFVHGTEEEIINFCDDNYDREEGDFAVYTLDDFLESLKQSDNNNLIKRKIER